MICNYVNNASSIYRVTMVRCRINMLHYSLTECFTGKTLEFLQLYIPGLTKLKGPTQSSHAIMYLCCCDEHWQKHAVERMGGTRLPLEFLQGDKEHTHWTFVEYIRNLVSVCVFSFITLVCMSYTCKQTFFWNTLNHLG